jgi:hypothetical protein
MRHTQCVLVLRVSTPMSASCSIQMHRLMKALGAVDRCKRDCNPEEWLPPIPARTVYTTRRRIRVQAGALGGPGPDRRRFNALHPCAVYFPLLNLKPRKLTSPEKQTGFQVLTAVVMRVLYSGIYRRVVRWKSTEVSDEHVASIFTIEE